MNKDRTMLHAVRAGREREIAVEIEVVRYLCLACGYTYDPRRGDKKGGIEPGTPGHELPPDWRCPTCGKDQTYFAKRDD